MDKPFHLMTPAERTALRIAQNRAIADKIAEQKLADERAGRSATPKPARRSAKSTTEAGPRVKPEAPPKGSTSDFTRATPEERAERGAFIRKVQS